MVLAYPYFKKDNMIYYVYLYDKETKQIHMLSYNIKTGLFQAILKRTVDKQGKITLDYRPRRHTVHISEMKEVLEWTQEFHVLQHQ